MLYFNWAQTFWIDKSAVQNAAEVAITRVDLYFRAKPPATNNKSGIVKPGVELKIVPCINGIPVINQMGAFRPTEPAEHGAKFNFYSGGQTARLEYDEILASGNAQVPSTFLFHSPIFVPTNGEYAVIIKFDGSENFVLWSTVVGDQLVGTTQISKGPSGNFRGTLYSFIDDPNKRSGTPLSNNAGIAYSNTVVGNTNANNAALVFGAGASMNEGWDTSYLVTNWTPLLNEDLKLDIYIARYAINGVPVISIANIASNNVLTNANNRPVMVANQNAVVANGLMTLTAPCQLTEYLLYNRANTTKGNLAYGEPFYQDGPAWPDNKSPVRVTVAPTNVTGANASFAQTLISANGSHVLPTGVTFNSGGGFRQFLSVGSIIVVRNDDGNTFIRQVGSFVSNTVISVGDRFPNTIANCTVSVLPVGHLNEVSTTTIFGKKQDYITLYDSIANTTNRFTSYSLAGYTINANGSGYSNNDYIRITGYEDIDYSVKGNYYGYANITTNGAGAITNVFFSNIGAGFCNVANVTYAINKSTAGVTSNTASDGTGANLTFSVGSSLESAWDNTVFSNTEVINIEVQRMKPEITINNPVGTSYVVKHRTRYYSVNDANTHLRKAYYIDTPSETANTDTVAKIFKAHTLRFPDIGKTPCLMSRSNEFITRFANGAVSNSSVWGTPYSNTAVFIFDISSNSDYQAVWFDPEIIMSHYGRYIINNDYTGEHTNYGNGLAKHIATKINLASNAFAEDILVYLTAYRPANSEIKVYARLHNAADPDPFDDTEWSLLELVDGVNVYSSSVDDSNYVELTYNLPAYPNTDFTLDGTVSLLQGNLSVTGNNTHFGPNVAITSGGTAYVNGDIVSFTNPNTVYSSNGNIFARKVAEPAKYTVTTDGSGVITALDLVTAGRGYTSQANVTSFTVANSIGGNSTGSTASLRFNPGLQANDLIKIYSPYTDWANTNYTIAIVNTVVSNTELTVKRLLGDIGPNLPGTAVVNADSDTINGVATSTSFTTDFSVGDFIGVWSNSSSYEVRQITSITDANTLVVSSNMTFTNTSAFYARIEAENFMNGSISVTGLLVDRLAYPHQAFNNIQNDNVARYYNSSMMMFDGFDTLQIKVVLLSDNDTIIPKVDDVRGIAVTA